MVQEVVWSLTAGGQYLIVSSSSYCTHKQALPPVIPLLKQFLRRENFSLSLKTILVNSTKGEMVITWPYSSFPVVWNMNRVQNQNHYTSQFLYILNHRILPHVTSPFPFFNSSTKSLAQFLAFRLFVVKLLNKNSCHLQTSSWDEKCWEYILNLSLLYITSATPRENLRRTAVYGIIEYMDRSGSTTSSSTMFTHSPRAGGFSTTLELSKLHSG